MIVREAEQARVRMTVEAQQEAEKLRAEIGDLQATRDRFSAEFRAMLSAYQELLEKRVIAVLQREPAEASPQPPTPSPQRSRSRPWRTLAALAASGAGIWPCWGW